MKIPTLLLYPLLVCNTVYSQQYSYCKKVNRCIKDESTVTWHIEKAKENNDVDFILDQIFLDSFLTENQHAGVQQFELKYINWDLTLNERYFPPNYNSQYVATIEALMDKMHIPQGERSFKIHSDHADIYNDIVIRNNIVAISGKTTEHRCEYKAGGTTTIRYFDPIKYSGMFDGKFPNDSVLLHTISADKYINKPCKVKVRCNNSTCWINDTVLNDAESKKYTVLVQRITGVKPKSEKDFTGVSYKPEDFKRFSVNL